jgi:hypothetical protein
VAVTAEQKKLWEDAADQGNTPGLERVPRVQGPVTQRVRAQASGGAPVSAPAASQATIQPSVRNEIRVLVYPNDPFASYTGPAQVASVDKSGERIELTLPGKLGTLTLLVRVDTKPLPVMAGGTVDVAYQVRRNPQVPNDVIAIRIPGGAGIAHVMQGGKSPVQSVAVPLFGFNVAQRDEPGFPVQISGPNVKLPIDVPVGQVGVVAGSGVMVRVVGSTGIQKGTNVALIEGVPFTLNVMVWRVP